VYKNFLNFRPLKGKKSHVVVSYVELQVKMLMSLLVLMHCDWLRQCGIVVGNE